MAKKRWQQQSDSNPPPTPPPKKPTAAAPGSRGRWRDRSTGETPGGMSRATINGIVGVFGLVIVLAGLVTLALWINPVPRPRLSIFTARYRTPLLPPNAMAVQDATTLCQQTDTLDPDGTEPTSLAVDELRTRISGLASVQPRRNWFSWEKTTTLAYVNMLGVALFDPGQKKSTAYLLPEDFEVWTQSLPGQVSRAIPVRSLLEGLLASGSDQKILVLDCQRLDHLWPLGVLSNEFVATVNQELDLINKSEPDKLKGLTVIFSCGPSEVTWVDTDAQQSAFGYYFARGIAGAADESGGDGDGRLTIKELTDYVAANVVNWSARNRADAQRPIVRAFGVELDAATLVSLPRTASFRPLRSPESGKEGGDPAPESASLLPLGKDYIELNNPNGYTLAQGQSQLKEGWKSYYELRAAPLSPWRYTPENWRDFEDTLLRSEDFLRAHDLTGLRDELSKLQARREAIDRARRDYTLRGTSYSLSMQQLLGVTDPGFAAIANDVANGTLPIVAAAKQLAAPQFAQESFPIETHLIRMFNDRLLADPSAPLTEAQRRSLEGEASAAVKQRILAERAATPALSDAPDLAPDVFRWGMVRVNSGDKLRRLREDLLFATGATQVDIDAGTLPTNNDDTRLLYEATLQETDIIAKAVILRQTLLAEIPYAVQLVSMRPWIREDKGFADKARDLVTKIVVGAKDLGADLDTDPNKLESAAAVTEKIRTLADSIAQNRQDLLQALAEEAAALGNTSQPPETQNDWHRINDILSVPFPSDPTDATESTRVRMNLVTRIIAGVRQQRRGPDAATTTGDNRGLATLAPNDLRAHIDKSADLGNRFFALGTGQVDDLSGDEHAAAGYKLGAAWRKIYDYAVVQTPTPGDYDALLHADAARRILDGYAAVRAKGPQELRHFNVSELFAWQASRFAKDFWAGSEGDPRPYYVRSSRAYLDQALAVAPRDAPWLVATRQTIDKLVPLDHALTLSSPEESIPFRGASTRKFQFDLQRPADYPQGVATFRARITDPDKVKVETEPRVTGGVIPLQLVRNDVTGSKGSTTLESILLFRGHVSPRPLPVDLVDYEVGPTVVYRMDRQGDGKISVRLEKAERSGRKLLFVLDLSGSMDERDKIGILRRVLAQFAASIDEGSVDVGVRFFGHRVPWIGNADPKLLPDALKDTELVLPIDSFNRDSFASMISTVKPAGGTPLYQAVAAARNDLESVPGEEKTILIISDGSDKFLGQPGYPSIQTLQKAYAGSGIEINAVGFGYGKGDDFGQLQSIVKTGAEGGEAVGAENADELLQQITRLSGVFSWAAHSATRSFPDPAQRLGVVSKPVPLPPASYDLKVVNSRDDVVDRRNPVRVATGELHAFALRGRKIEYEYDDFLNAIVGAEDPSSGVMLRVLEARPTQPAAADKKPGAYLKLAVFKKSQPAWRPGRLGIFVYPKDRDLMYSCQNLTWNEPDYHLPVWGISIEDWPEDVREADVEVRWMEPGEAEESTRLSFADWRSNGGAGKLPEGIQLESWITAQAGVGKENRNVSRLLFVFPESSRDFQEWSITFGDQPVEYARQVYNPVAKVLSGRYVLQNEEDPKEVVLHPPMPRTAGRTLKGRFRIGGNPLMEK